jgi:hypothetical protein
MSAFIYLPVILFGSIIVVCCAISIILRLETRRPAPARPQCRPFQPRVITGGRTAPLAVSPAPRVQLRLVGADE